MYLAEHLFKPALTVLRNRGFNILAYLTKSNAILPVYLRVGLLLENYIMYRFRYKPPPAIIPLSKTL